MSSNQPKQSVVSSTKAANLSVGARHSVEEDVYDLLLDYLISLKIYPGSRLPIDSLAREFGVSQTPIRSALIRLEAEGLVIKRHNAGYSAAPMPTRQRFQDTYEIRFLLEPVAAAKATESMTRKLETELQSLNRQMRQLVSADLRASYGKFALLDGQFHELLAQGSDNQVLSETLSRLYAHMNLFRLRLHTTVTEEAVKEHAQILEAISDREPEQAAEAMRHHITSSRERMQPYYDVLA